MSGSWVVGSVDATLREGVCTAASWSSGGMGREHVEQKKLCVEGGTKASRGILRMDASERELRERKLGEDVL